jgi:hypothetical protein
MTDKLGQAPALFGQPKAAMFQSQVSNWLFPQGFSGGLFGIGRPVDDWSAQRSTAANQAFNQTLQRTGNADRANAMWVKGLAGDPRDNPVLGGWGPTDIGALVGAVKMNAFHATKNKFDKFDASKIGARDEGHLGRGFYFMTDEAGAARGDPIVREDQIALDNPLQIKLPDFFTDKRHVVRDALGLPKTASVEDVTSALRAAGHDGVILDYSPTGYGHSEIMVMDAEHITPVRQTRVAK